MELIKQPEPGLCLACCVAMVAETSLEDVLANCRTLQPEHGVRYLPENEATKFLAARMLCYGARFKPGVAMTDELTHFEVLYPLREYPAILSVPSRNFKDYLHAVVWDNDHGTILDPLADEPRSITDYDIREWVPITPF